MSTLSIATQLDLINRKKIAAHTFGHRLDRANPVLSARRHDPFFTCHQRHDAGAFHSNDSVIDFACKQPQRQADHACPMAQHLLDSIMGFASIGRAKNGRNPGVLHLNFPGGVLRLNRLTLNFYCKPRKRVRCIRL